MHRLLSLTALLLLLVGCDRPVVDLAPPRVEVVSPTDLSVVQTDPILDLAIRAEVFGEIDSVAIGGLATTFDRNRNVYQASVSLIPGINILPVEIYDIDGLRGTDTLHVFQANLRTASAPVSGSPAPRAGAAASSLPSGSVFLSGGINPAGQAVAEGTLIRTRGETLSFSTVSLNEARTGHSSIALPDGRVLLIGGAQSNAPLTLVGTAEVVDLETATSAPVPIVTDQDAPASTARTGHVARLLSIDGVTVIYLYGGVNAQNVPLNTVDILRWEEDRLIRLSPPGGASISVPEGSARIPPFAQPAHETIGARGVSEGSSVVFGLPAGNDGITAFALDWFAPTGPRTPFDLVGRPIAPLSTPRELAATVFIDGIVLISGGTATDGTTLNTFEVYVPSVNRTFRFPDPVRLRIPRSDHTATLLPGGRILIVGGRDASGAALFAIEAFQL